MAYSNVTYNGNGSTKTFTVPFPYIDKAHVQVTVDGVVAAFTWLTPNTIQLSGAAPATGAKVKIARSSSRDARLVDFVGGSLLTESDLDLANTQAIYVAQEAYDLASGIAVDVAGIDNITLSDIGELIFLLTDGTSRNVGNVLGGSGVPSILVVAYPSISLSADGLTFTGFKGGWQNFPTGYSLQWLRDGLPILGATSETLARTDGDTGHSIQFQVTASNVHGNTTVVSAPFVPANIETGYTRVFYVSSSGSDSADGLTKNTAWKTITKVNASTFTAGDAILFEAGQQFSGNLVASQGGTSGGRITYGSYGTGRAEILGGTGKGFYAQNLAYLTVRDLVFIGAGPVTNTTHGVHFNNNLAGNVKLAGPWAVNLKIRQFGASGFFVDGTNGTSGFDGLKVRYVEAHDNTGGLITSAGTAGIYIRSGPSYSLGAAAHINTLVEFCSAYDNTGSPATANWTGSGIVIADSSDSIIRKSIAYRNGGLSQCAVGGPIGLFLFNALRCTIQDSIAHSNKGTVTGNGNGDGIDLDIGSKDCIVERCLTFNNDGSGILLFAGDPDNCLQASTGIVIRNCISIGDVVGSGQEAGAISIITLDPAASSVDIYQNTVFFTRGYGSLFFRRYTGSGVVTSKVSNNILWNSHATGFALYDDDAGGGFSAGGMTLKGNCYASKGRLAYFNGEAFMSLDGFLAVNTTQEKVGSTVVAVSAAPKFVNEANPQTPEDLKLAVGSPLADLGVNLFTALGIVAPTTDFFGDAVPVGLGPAIGAHDISAAALTGEAEINATYTVYDFDPTGGAVDPSVTPAALRDGTFTVASSWTAASGGSSATPVWIKADIGSVKTITAIQVAPRPSPSKSLRGAEVEVSVDGTNWTWVGSLYGLTYGALSRFPIGSRQARYVRLIKRDDAYHGTEETGFLGLCEFRILGY